MRRRGLAPSRKPCKALQVVLELWLSPFLIFCGMASGSGEGALDEPCRTRQAVPWYPRGLASLPTNRDPKAYGRIWVKSRASQPAVAQGEGAAWPWAAAEGGSEKGGAFQEKGEGHSWDRSERLMLTSEGQGGLESPGFFILRG